MRVLGFSMFTAIFPEALHFVETTPNVAVALYDSLHIMEQNEPLCELEPANIRY